MESQNHMSCRRTANESSARAAAPTEVSAIPLACPLHPFQYPLFEYPVGLATNRGCETHYVPCPSDGTLALMRELRKRNASHRLPSCSWHSWCVIVNHASQGATPHRGQDGGRVRHE